MKPNSNRKLPRFFIINPIVDRRLECRFESEEPVDIRDEETGHVYPGKSYDIGRKGLRLETKVVIAIGSTVQVAFRNNPENVRCFGHVVWSKPHEIGREYVSGVAVESWHGIVQGNDSWKTFKGIRPKRDRRRKSR